MDKTFVISVRNKRAKNLSKIKYVCGNTDYLVAFDLDEDWSGIEAKTARFRASDGTVIDTPFKGSTCPFPKIMASYRVDVGVFAGNLKTSTNAIVECERSALSNDGPPPDPAPDVYARIMELLNAGVSEEQITRAVEKYLEENPADATLSIAGRAADAKATGDAVRKLSEEKADKYLGVENAGAALIVGADGNIAVLVEDSGGEQTTVVAPVRVYEKGNCYVVTSSGKMFVNTNDWMTVAAYQVYAGKKYRFHGKSIADSTYTYVMGPTLYDKPESGFNAGVVYTTLQSEEPASDLYEYEITAEYDCYLYVQCGDPNYTYIDPAQNLVVVTAAVSSKASAAARYAVSSDGDGIEISYPYSEDTLTVTLNKRGGNNLFDFRKIETETVTLFDSHSSDWHAPFVVAAVNNADGDAPGNKYFTGGNHQTNNTGSGGAATARTSALKFYADGKLLSAGDSGHADRIEMRWTNLVQGYNTSKSDGSGREILQENHTMTFVNGKYETYVEIVPLEAVTMETWYGLQGCMTSAYPKIRYPGGTNRGEYEGNSDSGDATTYVMECYGDAHKMRIEVDPLLDLGRRNEAFATGTKGAFSAEYGKCYFTIVNKDVSMAAGDMYCLRGSYEFAPR